MPNVLPGLNFYGDETKFEAIAKRKKYTWFISFSDIFHSPFLRVVYINLWSGVLLPFFLRRREEKVPFSLASYVVNNPILHLIIHIQLRSIPFLNISGVICHMRPMLGIIQGRGSFAIFWGSFAVGDHLQHWTLLSGPMTVTQNSQIFFIHVLDLRVTFCCSNYHDEEPF